MILNKELRSKLSKFKQDKRAYFSFLFLLAAFLLTLPAELICNVRPILLTIDGKPYLPIFIQYSERDFGGTLPSEPDYKSEDFMLLLSGQHQNRSINQKDNDQTVFSLTLQDFEEEAPNAFVVEMDDFGEEKQEASNSRQELQPKSSRLNRKYFMLWPPIRYDYKYIPTQSKTGNVVLAPPYPTHDNGKVVESAWVDGHYLGTDDRGRDVLARLIYGFRISMIFGISLAITGTLIGCLLGGIQGFLGGWVDLIGQRLTEIWGSIPRLYILIILSSFLVPSAVILFLILNLTAWMGISAYIRAEFLKIRNLEYVKAAKAMGVSNIEIMWRHILPNSLTPVITFFPFEITSGILALVSLDFLNLGVPSPAPSMGELLAQGKSNLQAIWIILPTFTILTTTLTLLTFIGEGIRNAFDPRKA
ncbi:MAG: peptide ABC transporter permease [Nitrospinae bacterium RIFCSPLOWO2_12_FULL_47_7]|nr:MAG: peptide ABC transporter permease [Nitrospinae bacterium RIFCSPLOWO2_12_FULL_47_7]